MKTSTVGLVLGAILMVVAGVDSGIAQAGGNHSEQPVLSFEDIKAFEQGSSSSPFAENRPVLAFEDSSSPFVENRPVLSFADDMQLRNPTGTGSLPDGSNADSSIKETEGGMFRQGIDDGP